VSATLIEKTVASHDALAWHVLDKAAAREAFAMSRHALARHELEKAMAREALVASHHALARHKLEKLWLIRHNWRLIMPFLAAS
jgi:hypothetical protein